MRLFYLPSSLNWNHPKTQAQLGAADVLVFQRNVLSPEVWDAMDYWRAIGKAVCIDLDDHYPGLPASNPAYQYWIRNVNGMPQPPIESLAEGLRHADALTTPSKVIAKDWAHIVPGFWIPNYTRRAWYAGLKQKEAGAADIIFDYARKSKTEMQFRGFERPDSKGQIMLGWGGSISHVDSWIYSGIIEALDRLFEKHPNVRLKFCGHESRLNYIFDKWPARVVRQGGVKPEQWPHVISSFDIGLAPLDMRPLDPPWREGGPVTSYDDRRSWLKAIEYLSAGVPWVASKSNVYGDLSRWGTLVENTPDAWFRALDNKITYLQAEKALAWDRRRWALNKVTAEGNVSTIADTYGRIIASKLTRTGQRLPGVTYVEARAEAR